MLEILGIQDIRYSREQARWTVEFSRKGIIEKPFIHFNGKYGKINLLYRTVHAANQLCIYGQSQSGVDRIPEMQAKADPKAFARCSPEIQKKQEDLKSLVDIPRLPHASGNRMLQNWKDFIAVPFRTRTENPRTAANSTTRSRKETSMSQLLFVMTDGESALRCAKNVQRPETERIQSHTHQLMQKKKWVQS